MVGGLALAPEPRQRYWRYGVVLLLALLTSAVSMYLTATAVLISRGSGTFPFSFAAVLSADYRALGSDGAPIEMLSVTIDSASGEALVSLYQADGATFSPASPGLAEEAMRDSAAYRRDAEPTGGLVEADVTAPPPVPGPASASPAAGGPADPPAGLPSAGDGLALGTALPTVPAATPESGRPTPTGGPT